MSSRQTRARSSNAATPSQTASSTSTSTLKQTRSVQRSESAEDATEDNESQATESTMQPRRSRRNGAEDTVKESSQKKEPDTEEAVDEDGVEEEVTRCICGQLEYPGPSDILRQMVKDQALLALGDELGSFFVQCDNCSVWQHGGCVGLTNEQTLPDEYYCEQCKPDLHKLLRNGTKSSLYRPVFEAEQSSRSPSTSSDRRKNSKDSKSSEPAKRRATMNSRGAYDEDEMLRRVIEESKHDGAGTLGKRARDDADEYAVRESDSGKVLTNGSAKPAVKRQRTASSSHSSQDRSVSPGTIDPNSKSRGNLRGAATRNNKEKEARDRVKADMIAAKAEAAHRRNARSERRRGEDSPPPTPSLSPSKGLHTKGKAISGSIDATPPSLAGTKKKTLAARMANRGRGRVGRNQYTRDRDLDSDTAMRDTSHERNGHASPNGAHNDSSNSKNNGNGAGFGKQSKARNVPARISWNEMNRRVSGMLEFVRRYQAANPSTNNSGNGTPNSDSSGNKPDPVTEHLYGAVQGLAATTAAELQSGKSDGGSDGDEKENGKMNLMSREEFDKLSKNEKLDVFTKNLLAWQERFSKWVK